MRLLVVEDDPQMVAALRRGLRSAYIVDVAYCANEALELTEVSDYDLVLLDLGLPDKDGTSLCQEWRREGMIAPILTISGRASTDEKIAALDSGADDYLLKPFDMDELKARIRALLRRDSGSVVDSRLRLNDLVLDTANRTAERQGRHLHLRRKEFDLLEYLMVNAGKTLSRQMILDHVWDMNETLWTNAIDVHIKYLRDKIDRPYGTALIKTVHGIGYKMVDTQVSSQTAAIGPRHVNLYYFINQ